MEVRAPAGRDTILGFDRNLFYAGLVSFLTDTSAKMDYSVMPLFLMSLGASKTTLAAIVTPVYAAVRSSS